VVSLPYRLRYLLAWDHDLYRAVTGVFVRAVLRSLRWRAGRAGVAAAPWRSCTGAAPRTGPSLSPDGFRVAYNMFDSGSRSVPRL